MKIYFKEAQKQPATLMDTYNEFMEECKKLGADVFDTDGYGIFVMPVQCGEYKAGFRVNIEGTIEFLKVYGERQYDTASSQKFFAQEIAWLIEMLTKVSKTIKLKVFIR